MDGAEDTGVRAGVIKGATKPGDRITEGPGC